MSRNLFAMALASTVLTAPLASADEINLRGGIASGFANEYIYALEDDQVTPVETDYGLGGFGSATYQMDNVYQGVGLEIGLQIGGLSGSDDSGGELNSECDGGIETYLGLISDCQDRADIENATVFADASVLASYVVGTAGTELLGGVSYLSVNNDLTAEYLFPEGFENFVDRNTEFSGFGLKLGVRQQTPLPNGMTFQVEAFIAQYRGDRTMDIVDEETDVGAFNAEETATFEDEIDVTTFELTPSIAMDASWAGAGATMEFGVSYKLFSGVVDTRNVESHGDLDPFDEGDENDDISSTSIFAGLTIPLP